MADNYATERALLGPAIISFPQLFQPGQMTGKYETDVIYEEGSSTHKKILELEKEGLDARFNGRKPRGFNSIVQVGGAKTNGEGEPLDGYAGMLYSKARTNRPPKVTDVDNHDVEDPMEVKGGDLCVVLVHAYAYDNTTYKKKGVLLTLHGVRKIKDGEAFGSSGGGNSAEEMAGYEADAGEDQEF